MSSAPIQFQPHPIDFQATGPQKRLFSGLHFSDNEIQGSVLQGARRGSSSESSDAERLHVGPGAPPAIHVYRSNSVGHPHITSRKHVYHVQGQYAVNDIDTDPTFRNTVTSEFQKNAAAGMEKHEAHLAAVNAAEHFLRKSGYDGYEATKSAPGSVTLFGDHPISGGQNAPNS